jgi:ATP-dependent RNA helicase RhlE
LPPELNRLAKEALVEPMRVDVAPATAKPAAGITQAIYPVPKDLKFDLLDDLLSRAEVRSTIIFARAKSAAERLAKQLKRHGHAVAVLDEHPNQGERERALDDLRRGRIQILVASESAARSLDVAGTAHVVNFHVPTTPEDYVHRLGRGGRADPVGDAFTLMSPDEQSDVAAIERFLGRAIPRVMLPDFDYGMAPREIKHVVTYEPERIEHRSGSATAARTASRARPPVKSAAMVNKHRPSTNGKPRSPAERTKPSSRAAVVANRGRASRSSTARKRAR